MTGCADRQSKRALEALFRGELEAEGYRRLREHVAGCAGCRELYERLGRVESALERRVLPGGREALLEQALFARLRTEARPRAPARARPAYLRPALGLAVCVGGGLLLAVPLLSREQAPEWRAREGEAGAAWGVRAFCVSREGRVRGEARPGGVLVCPEGGSVQFSYTAPEAARLLLRARSPSGEPLQFFPQEGQAAEVASGVDVLLPHSTPVEGGWLSGPLEVTARFSDAAGRPLAQSRLTLTPE